MNDAIDNRLGPNFGRPLSHCPLSEQIARLTAENARLRERVEARELSAAERNRPWEGALQHAHKRAATAEAERDALAGQIERLQEQFERVMAATCEACNGLAGRDHWWLCVSARAALAAAGGEGQP